MIRAVTHELASVLALRGVALGGRFLFVIFAAKNMAPDEFGRFGMLQALALIVSAVVGLEAYQVLLRRIQNAPAEEASELRHAYGLFALAATATAALAALGILAVINWTGVALLLGVLIVAGEHLSTEAYRNLVNEHRPGPAVLNVAMRTGIWGVLIPALDLAGLLPRPWPLEMVLLFWLGGLTVGFAVSLPLWRDFLPFTGLHRQNLRAIAGDVIAKSRVWLTVAVAWRVIENGGRFVAAWLISEAAAGQFTLLGMIASISFVAQKSVIEPVYFPRLIGPNHTAAERRFFQLSLLCTLAGAIAASAAWAAVIWMNGVAPSANDVGAFVSLLVAFSALTLSQVPHFKLYRRHEDRRIATTTLIGAVTTTAVALLLGHQYGVAGVAAGTALGALSVLVGKLRVAARSGTQ